MNTIVAAKVQQAVELMREMDLPLWIVQFARESYDHPQPVQELAVGTTVTWPSAFIIADSGATFAVVATGDVANVIEVGAYETVIGYVQDIGPELRRILSELSPGRIGVSYSLDDDSADNITHGMFSVLQTCLEGTVFAERVVSAENVLGALRSRKLPQELACMRQATDTTLEVIGEIEAMLQPGVTERETADMVHASVMRRGLTAAWDHRYDPVVKFGPASKFGHAAPSDIALAPGMVVHVDIGIKQEGYCSDLQRMWYILRDGENEAPDEVMRPFDTVLRSMQEGFKTLRPGVQGWEVDAAARKVIVDAGYDEPQFSLGHQLGQSTHDGGCLLGPRWPRYGSRPEMRVEQGNVFTLEYALPSPAGTIGLEEDVVVTESGAEYLCAPQTELRFLRV
jgi:Xaa-Pro aminopeptidase